MENLLISLLLLIHTCTVVAENVGGACERQHDGVECGESSADDLQKHTSVHDETHMSGDNVERAQ